MEDKDIKIDPVTKNMKNTLIGIVIIVIISGLISYMGGISVDDESSNSYEYSEEQPF